MISADICLQSFHLAYPDCQLESVEFNQTGQNNDVLTINGALILRFPRYAQGIADLQVETALLRGIRRYVSLEIPDPQFVHLEGQAPGQAFVGYPRLPGETLKSLSDPLIVARLAQQLGEFLRCLHSLPAAEAIPLSLPVVDTWADCNELYGRIRKKLFAYMRPEARQQVVRHFEAFLGEANNFVFQPALKHGDFGPSNILCDAGDQAVCGIIDFSGSGLCDPAYDFAGLLSGYGVAFVRECGAAYPELDSLLPRARFYQGTFALMEALFGVENNDPQAFENGIKAYC